MKTLVFFPEQPSAHFGIAVCNQEVVCMPTK
jgi:hypothetical protein